MAQFACTVGVAGLDLEEKQVAVQRCAERLCGDVTGCSDGRGAAAQFGDACQLMLLPVVLLVLVRVLVLLVLQGSAAVCCRLCWGWFCSLACLLHRCQTGGCRMDPLIKV